MQATTLDQLTRNAVANSQALKERRKCCRRPAGDSIFAVCMTDSVIRLGKVTDVSRGGIALQYLSFDADERDFILGPARIEVFDRGSICRLEEDVCSVVYDFPVPRGNTFLSKYQMRRCGVSFAYLSNEQYLLLDSIIHISKFPPPDDIVMRPADQTISLATGQYCQLTGLR